MGRSRNICLRAMTCVATSAPRWDDTREHARTRGSEPRDVSTRLEGMAQESEQELVALSHEI